ncbi:MAG TPA: primosomal protein N', partial [Dokdonella sp.]|nr:primosomal protein N' [Dokdonella sp.]
MLPDPVPMPHFVRVAVPVPLHRLFDYRLADGMTVVLGARVLVPFGRRRVVGVVIEQADVSDQAEADLKSVLEVLDERAWLSRELLATLCWAARYYQHPIGEVVEAALPVALRSAGTTAVARASWHALTDAGRVALVDPHRRRGTRLDALLSRLAAGAVTADVLDAEQPGWREAARRLRERGWIETVAAPEMLAHWRVAERSGPPLNPAQAAAVAAISAAAERFATFLLDGVTGSGKTEVYLHAILDAIGRGRQALVLVPEIALTPQTMRRFRERLGLDVAILHSGLADGERARAWLAAARGEAAVVLGTRSAAFVPLARPGLIVVDEEHDASYKQHEGFRYHARDLAIVRAKALGIPVVLGSATPSLESLANVEVGRYAHLVLRERAGDARPPALRVMDIRHRRLEQGLAVETLQAIGRHLGEGGQVLVFRNRRGYAPVLFCHACGWTAQCMRCARSMTVHRGTGRLCCHHCGDEKRLPRVCPDCTSEALAPQGQGTERLEETLIERFPGA